MLLLLLLPTLMLMPKRHHRLMQGRVEVSLRSRGLLASAGGGRLSVLCVVACLASVFDLYTRLLCPALSLQELFPFHTLFFLLQLSWQKFRPALLFSKNT